MRKICRLQTKSGKCNKDKHSWDTSPWPHFIDILPWHSEITVRSRMFIHRIRMVIGDVRIFVLLKCIGFRFIDSYGCICFVLCTYVTPLSPASLLTLLDPILIIRDSTSSNSSFSSWSEADKVMMIWENIREQQSSLNIVTGWRDVLHWITESH